TLRAFAGMITTVADNSATIDFEAYKIDGDNTVGSDLIDTSAQDINNLAFANQDFTVTPTGLAAGDVLDVRVAVAVNDAAAGTAVIAAIGRLDLLCDVKG